MLAAAHPHPQPRGQVLKGISMFSELWNYNCDCPSLFLPDPCILLLIPFCLTPRKTLLFVYSRVSIFKENIISQREERA